MYYRRKVILSILGEFGGQVTKTSFQKLLFIFTRSQEEKSYDFVPYTYGCFSFSANQDLLTLTKYGVVKELHIESYQYWQKADNMHYTLQLTKPDYDLIKTLVKTFGNFDQEELIKYTYEHYPYYAINSRIAAKLLDYRTLRKIQEQKRIIHDTSVFTIGYEGKSLEQFINQLIINNIRILIDVRKNALSKKFGFSKSQISKACESLNIKYLHIPELGINSDKRKDLKSTNDYVTLLNEYEKTVLPNSKAHLNFIIENLRHSKRIALMCFEKDASICHRGRVVNSLSKLLHGKIPIKNL